MRKVGAILREMRREAGLSQGQVSKKLGFTSPQFVSNWERSLVSIPSRHVLKIAKLYKVNPSKLINPMVAEYRERLKFEASVGC